MNNQILSEIESHEFAGRLGLANTTEMLFALARQEKAVKELIVALQSRDEATHFLSHIVSLLKEQEDVRYRNSRDTAIAVYVWALKQTHERLAKLIASEILGLPRLWWARKAAIEIAGRPESEVESSTGEQLIKGDSRAWVAVTKAKNVLIVSEPVNVDLNLEDQIIMSDNIVTTSEGANPHNDDHSLTTNSTSQIEELRTEAVTQ